jgi:hypothetical protein
MCVLTLKIPMAPMGDSHVCSACCLQGGGVYVGRGTVTISSSTISGNTADYARAHAQKFPSPPWETHVALCLQGGGVYRVYVYSDVQSGTVTISSSTITGNTAEQDVRAHYREFPSPRWEKC